jgi:hypothetical protein
MKDIFLGQARKALRFEIFSVTKTKDKEIGLEVNAEKSKYMWSCLEIRTQDNVNIQRDNKSFETVEQFQYLGKPLTNHSDIHEEIKSRLKSGNACYHSVQYRAISRVKILKCSDISRTNSVPIFRVLGLPSTLKMGTELVPETSKYFNILTRLLARENFI